MNADVVVSLDDDVLAATHPNNVEYAKQLTTRRRVTSRDDAMNRIYSIENGFSITGSLPITGCVKAKYMPLLMRLRNINRINGLSAYSQVTISYPYPFLGNFSQ